MTYKRKNKIVFRIEQEVHGSYRQYTTTHIRIQTMDAIKVTERIYWSCENPDYFGTPEPYQALATQGHEVFYDIDYGDCEVYLSYLHSDGGGYCAHAIGDLRRGLRQMKWANTLLTKVSRQIAKAQDRYYGPKDDYSFRLDSPEAVVEALRSMGAVEIEYTGGNVNLSRAVARYSQPHTFRTESAA